MKRTNKGMTLNEIMLAMVILALAFIPIVGAISSSMKATEKDDHIIKAMELCQEKLGIAVQFPFDFFSPGTYNTKQESPNTGGHRLILNLGEENFRINYTSSLEVTAENVSFNVPMVDFTQKPEDYSNPGNWIHTENVTINDMVKRYTVTVTWKEPGDAPSVPLKFYKLSVLKANVKR